jgi:hypothetical protein
MTGDPDFGSPFFLSLLAQRQAQTPSRDPAKNLHRSSVFLHRGKLRRGHARGQIHAGRVPPRYAKSLIELTFPQRCAIIGT